MKNFCGLALGIVAIFLSHLAFCSPKKQPKTTHYPVTEEKPFVVVIPSYNNANYVERNLRSVFSQRYENFRVIYIDDNSRDDTLQKAKKLLKELDPQGRTSLVHNPANYGALANIYNAVHSCHDREIVVLLDGDDFLAHEKVLQTLNETYANPHVWVTYGNYLDYPSFQQNPRICKKLPEKVIHERTFRNHEWVTTHLRTFYATLFKEIPITDFFYQGRFYPMGSDLAIMLPLLEMASSHVGFIEDILYLYNRENPISDHKIHIALQRECAKHIGAKPRYPSLSQLPTHEPQKQTADLLIFSDNRPLQLYSLLESIQNYAFGLKKITAVYQAPSPEMESCYLALKLDFPNVQFIKGGKSLPSLIDAIAFAHPLSESHYLAVADDNLVLTDVVDFSQAIPSLELSKAYGLFFTYHQKLTFSHELMRHQPLPLSFPLAGLPSSSEAPFAWQFSSGVDDWNTPNHFSLALYRKDDLRKVFHALSFDSFQSLKEEWSHHIPENGIGLYYQEPKCAYLTFPSLSEKELREKFEEGLKIDLTRLPHEESFSQEISINTPFFIPRN